MGEESDIIGGDRGPPPSPPEVRDRARKQRGEPRTRERADPKESAAAGERAGKRGSHRTPSEIPIAQSEKQEIRERVE